MRVEKTEKVIVTKDENKLLDDIYDLVENILINAENEELCAIGNRLIDGLDDLAQFTEIETERC